VTSKRILFSGKRFFSGNEFSGKERILILETELFGFIEKTLTSETGNRTRIFRVTGGNTDHYTISDRKRRANRSFLASSGTMF
jgi:hypothetical protein